jgi:CRP-like cAMP-binding protein
MVNGEFLQAHALFGGISDKNIQDIIPLLREKTFSKGEFIVNEGENGSHLYFICEGSVEVLKKAHTPEGVVQGRLAILGKGDTFGEMELIDVQPRSASIRTLEPVSALTLSHENMYKLYKSNLETFTMIVMNIAREISRRLRNMDDLVVRGIDLGPRNGGGKTEPI